MKSAFGRFLPVVTGRNRLIAVTRRVLRSELKRSQAPSTSMPQGCHQLSNDVCFDGSFIGALLKSSATC